MPALAPPPTSARLRLSPRAAAVGLQLLLWGLLTGFYFAWNSRANFHFTSPVWPLVLLRLSFAVVLFNSLVYLIIPRWLLRGRYLLALAGALLLVVAYVLWEYVGVGLIAAYLPPEDDVRQHLVRYYPADLWQHLTSPAKLQNWAFELLATMLFPIVVSFMAYALIIDRRRLALERNQLGLELSYRKAQLNPQFLFNALGHLRALTRARDPQAGDMVLHLADLLRYTLYETDAARVPLARELEFLDDYLALERLRHPQATIRHHVSGPATTQLLRPATTAPLLRAALYRPHCRRTRARRKHGAGSRYYPHYFARLLPGPGAALPNQCADSSRPTPLAAPIPPTGTRCVCTRLKAGCACISGLMSRLSLLRWSK